jgi:hypothetical protein
MTRLPGAASELADHLLATDPYLRALADELWRGQRRLRRSAGLEAYRLYLRIEEVANERLLALVGLVWAFAQAHERSRRESHPDVKSFRGV